MSVRPFIRSCPMVVRIYVLSLHKELILRSHSQLVIPTVNNSCTKINKLGKNPLSNYFRAQAAVLGAFWLLLPLHLLIQMCISALILSGEGRSVRCKATNANIAPPLPTVLTIRIVNHTWHHVHGIYIGSFLWIIPLTL